jgi:exopolysaccharide production protein ExoQ
MDGFYGHSTSPSGRPPTAVERFFAVAVLFFSTGAFWRLLQGSRDVETGTWTGAVVTNCLWITAYLTAFGFLRSRCTIPWHLWKRVVVFLLPVPVAAASLLWSDDRLITFLRCTALIGTTMLALYFALRFSEREILHFAAYALGLAAVGSFVAAVCVPSFAVGTDEYEGIWLGAFAQKNELGGMMAVSFLVYLLLFWHERSRRAIWFAFAVLSLFLVLKADSMTSFAICCAIPYLLWVSKKTLTREVGAVKRLLYFGFPVFLLVAALVVEFDSVVEAMGRSTDLTGRTLLWVLASGAALEQPYLGHGYEAFWRGYEGAAGDIWAQVGHFYYYSHNGFIEIVLGLGMVGLIAMLIALIFFAKHALRALRTERALSSFWPWALLLYLILSNLLEGNLMKSNNLPWLLYTITALSLCTTSGHSKRVAERNVPLH